MPLLFIVIPLVAVIVLNLLNGQGGRKIAFAAGITVAVIQMLLAVSAAAGGVVWLPIISNFTVDILSATVLFTIGMIALVSLIVGKYSDNKDIFNFINMILLIMIGMNGVTMVSDLFTLYVFLEISAVLSFVLIAMYKDIEGLEGAFKYFVLSAVATAFMLAGIAFILITVGDTGFSAVSGYMAGFNGKYPFELILAFVLFTTGLSIKAGLVPFHGWVPDAYSSASPGVSVLLAGIVTKVVGVYTLMRLYKDVFKNAGLIGDVLVVLGLISIVVGALAAIGQSDYKRMLAYSSISQIGYIILGVGLGTSLGFIGALLHFFNHATFKSLLFINSTAVEMQTGTRDMKKLGGLAAKMPITGGTSVIGFLSTAGIPPLSGFWSKFIIIMAAWTAGSHISAVVALLASVLTLGYFLILQRNLFFGKPGESMEKVTESNKGIISAEILLSAVTLAVGVLFPLVLLFVQSKGLI